MKIFDSHQYVDLERRVKPFYQLRVISQWDFGTKPICFRKMNGFLGKSFTCAYSLGLHTKINNGRFGIEKVETLTPEMIEELTKMGYIVPEK